MKKLFYILLIIIAASCTQKYTPTLRPSSNNFLVMEGTLNSGSGLALLTLSRSTNLDSPSTQYEQGAQITVQASDSSTFTLQETSAAKYTASDLNLDTTKKYRLKILTSNGEIYTSDFVSVIPNPPIDSISYQQNNSGLQISVNTHNPQNNTRYYQWLYNETWEFHSAYLSKLKYVITQTPQGYEYALTPATVAYYPPDPYDSSIFICWQSDSSNQILLGSSATLSQDIINVPITTVAAGSQKLTVLFSINIHQYGWSEQGFQFLQTMQKNTENTASIFNPLPSQLVSNIHCINNPAKMVLGFFNISPAQEKRFFIYAKQVQDWNYSMTCPLLQFVNQPDSIAKYASSFLPIIAAKTKPIPFSLNLQILTFSASFPACVDCTLNGTNIKPAYWPN